MGPTRRNITKIIVSAALAILVLILLVTFPADDRADHRRLLLAFILGYPVNWIQRSTTMRGAAVLVVMSRSSH